MLIIMKFVCYMVIILTLTSVTVVARPPLDNCDWSGSGTLEMALSRGVQPVYLRCNQGTIRWHYPQGALRIVLQHRTEGSNFSACIKRSNTTSGARIYLAGIKKLHLVFNNDDPKDLVRCVSSQRGQVALYMEANPITDALRQATAEFSYHLKKVATRSSKDFSDDCQPCTDEQLLRHYCTSDFVIQGTVTGLFNNRALQLTELTIRVSRYHRINELDKLLTHSNSTAVPFKYIVLHRPLSCGTRAGTGEYLFLGKWVLGNPSLYCIPRIVEWKKVRRKAIITGMNECLL
ncbi:meteorin-like protein [Stegodyphus dumicola]|uniref:meteorin-like protein n=1 Tax=Stegodyphus dumicola TaxID=202533 RepID=UPI0015A7C98A|nr:meteorin-like protein [Stegodyphus dumicola]